MTTLLALPIAASVGIAAWLARALTRSGAMAATLCGWIALSAGWDWAIVLITYFISASLVSRLSERTRNSQGNSHTPTRHPPPSAPSAIVAKTGARDAAQVFANGGVFMLFALASIIAPHPLWLAGALSALTTSAADTFATEIGALSSHPPRSILSSQPVPTGTSGGISWLGTTGAILGSSCVVAAAYIREWPLTIVLTAFIAGILGMLIDSVLGATVQARRECPVCQSLTERAIHTCGTTTRLSGGIPWIGNDLVNALATFAGAVTGMLLSSIPWHTS